MKNFCLLMCAAAAAAFAGCSQDQTETPSPERPQVQIAITAQTDTRTVIGADNKISWSEAGEALEVVQTIDGQSTFAATTSHTTDATGKASFTVSFPENTTGTKYDYSAIYPQSAYVNKDDNTTLTEIRVALPQLQSPTATSFDPAADLMIARPVSLTAQAQQLDFAFGRIVALAKMSIKNLGLHEGESVKSILFSAPNQVLSGWGKVDLEKGVPLSAEWGYTSNYKFDNVELKYADDAIATANFDAWLACAPCSLTENATFQVAVRTTRGTYTRTVTLGAGQTLAFTIGALSTFTVDMTSATFEEAVVDTSVFTVTFGENAKTKVDYVEGMDMGATGLSAANLTYTFNKTSEALRSTNQLSGYPGASGKLGWWCPKAETLTLGNVTLGEGTDFALSFGAGAGQTTIQAYISKNGTDFFPLSEAGAETPAVKAGEELLHVFNFRLDQAVTAPISIKFENIGTGSCAVDDLKLVALDAPAADAYLVDFLVPPTLTSVPGDNGIVSFAANNGTPGTAPAAEEILYEWTGENCTFKVEKAQADTWYTLSDNGQGVVTVTAEEYTATDVDRTGTITLTVLKNGVAAKTHTLTVLQRKVGEAVQKTLTIDATSPYPGSYSESQPTAAEKTIDGLDLYFYHTYLNGKKLQFYKNAGYVANKTSLNKILSVTVNYNSSDTGKNFTLYVGNEELPATTKITPSAAGTTYTFDCSTGNYNFFKLINGSGVGYIDSIEIVYE